MKRSSDDDDELDMDDDDGMDSDGDISPFNLLLDDLIDDVNSENVNVLLLLQLSFGVSRLASSSSFIGAFVC